MNDVQGMSAPAQRFAAVRAAFEADPHRFRMSKLDIVAVFAYVAELQSAFSSEHTPEYVQGYRDAVRDAHAQVEVFEAGIVIEDAFWSLAADKFEEREDSE